MEGELGLDPRREVVELGGFIQKWAATFLIGFGRIDADSEMARLFDGAAGAVANRGLKFTERASGG